MIRNSVFVHVFMCSLYVDSNRATRWRAAEAWNPIAVWQAYVNSVMKGDRTLHVAVWLCYSLPVLCSL